MACSQKLQPRASALSFSAVFARGQQVKQLMGGFGVETDALWLLSSRKSCTGERDGGVAVFGFMVFKKCYKLG